MAAIASKPVKVKYTLSDGKKIKIFISDVRIQAHHLYAQKVKIESERLIKLDVYNLAENGIYVNN